MPTATKQSQLSVTLPRESFHNAFTLAASVAPKRSPQPILQYVKLHADDAGEVHLMATDREVDICLRVPEATIDTPGDVLLPVERFNSLLREADSEQITLAVKASHVEVTAGRGTYQLQTANPDEFPSFSVTPDNWPPCVISTAVLHEAIRRTVFAVGREDDSRYVMSGICFDFSAVKKSKKLNTVGTDGRRLAWYAAAVTLDSPLNTDEMRVQVPGRAVKLLDRALSLVGETVRFGMILPGSGRHIAVLAADNLTVTTRLLEGKFPKWQDIVPKNIAGERREIKVEANEFCAAIRQAAIVSNSESRGIDFEFGADEIQLSGQTAEVGASKVTLPLVSSSDLTFRNVTLGHDYVVEFLRAVAGQTVTISIHDADSGVVFSTDDGSTYIVMPLARER